MGKNSVSPLRLLLRVIAIAFTALALCGNAHAIVTVSADGSGDFKTIQAAIDAAPPSTSTQPNAHATASAPVLNPAKPWIIHIRPGTYTERIQIPKTAPAITLRGDKPSAASTSTSTTTIAFALHANSPDPSTPGKTLGTFRTATAVLEANDITCENLTFANTAGPIGQALAIRADGDRLTFRHCRFLGWQDTLLLNRGRHYFEDCYIEGHVDFIFGGATAYFSRCEIHALRNGYITAASTPAETAHGFVFADCRITAEPNVKTYLGRPWRPFAKTVFIRTEMSAAVRAEGWHNWNKPDAEKTTFYAEYGSTAAGASGSSTSTYSSERDSASKRAPWSHALTEKEASAYTPAAVLGGSDNWKIER